MCSPRFWKGLSNRPFSPHGRALRWRPKLYSRGFHTDGKDELCSGRRARQAFPDTLRAHPWALGRRHPCRRTVREGLSHSPLWEAGILELPSGKSRRLPTDRKSTRLNSSHVASSYAVFCLKKKSMEGVHDAEHSPRG